MIAAGELNKRIILLLGPQTLTDTDGAVTLDHAQRVLVWASVDFLSGRKLFLAQQVSSEASCEVRIRYRRDVTPKTIIEYGTRKLEVLFVGDPKEAHEELVLTCKEVVERGDI
jgi:SPP1 family predicted phage head-tail adaptor